MLFMPGRLNADCRLLCAFVKCRPTFIVNREFEKSSCRRRETFMLISQLLSGEATPNSQLGPEDIFRLSVLATAGLAAMWLAFWAAVVLRKESVHEILLSAGFFRTVAVMGVVAATVVLSLAGRLEGNITGAILSGIVWYVLGHLSGRGRGKTQNEQ